MFAMGSGRSALRVAVAMTVCHTTALRNYAPAVLINKVHLLIVFQKIVVLRRTFLSSVPQLRQHFNNNRFVAIVIF